MKEKHMKRIAAYLLHLAECFYLYAHGWRKAVPFDDSWLAPASYPYKKTCAYRQGHALNATKYWRAHCRPR